MKAIMISIKPKWCAKIMNGEKTIEIRKNKALATAIQKLIDVNGYAEIYVYCSKSNYLGYISNRYVGKVVFKFRCYKIDDYVYDLEIFDKPEELSEFYRVCNKCPFKNSQVCFDHCGEDICKITKAPQNFRYVEVE